MQSRVQKKTYEYPAFDRFRLIAAFLAVSLAAMLAESGITGYLGWQKHNSMYLCLPFVMLFLFEGLRRGICPHLPHLALQMFRSVPMWIYLIHPLVIVGLRGAAGIIGMEALVTAFPFVFYLAVCTVSFIFGVCCFFAGGLMRSALHKTARAQMAVHAVIPVRGRRYGRTETSRAWVELDRENLKKNVEFFRKLSGADAKLMPAVKANAYGHGALLVAQELQRLGIHDFCVATAEEGAALRKAGIRGQILVLGFTAPEAFGLLMRYDLTQTVVDSAYASLLGGSGRTLKVHVGVDTGMHRLGIPWEDIETVKQVWNYRNLRVTGVFSHLCAADEQSSAAETFTRLQIERFQAVREALLAVGLRNFKVHLQSSYGILNYPEWHYDYVRCGIALYGILSCGQDVTKITPQISPVLSLKARIGCIRAVKAGEGAGYGMEYRAKRDSRIAVLSIGYADGIPREVAGRGHVLIEGKIAPVVGRICMDQMLCDVTDIPEAESCGEAVLIGNSGARCITAEQYAGWADTISNEVVSRLGERLKRVWK